MFFCPPGVILSFTYWGLCHHRRTGNTYESYEYNGMTLGVFYHGINLPFFARCIMFKYPFVVREVPWHKSGESVTWGSVTGIRRFVQWLNTAWRAVSCTKTRGKSSRRPAVWKAGRRDFLRWQIVSEFVEVFSSTNKNGATNRRIHRCLVGDSCQWS